VRREGDPGLRSVPEDGSDGILTEAREFLLIRPIRHRTEERVPAHIFLCQLAYYVEWHLRRVWAPLLFEDEELPKEQQRRDPVLPAPSSESAQAAN